MGVRFRWSAAACALSVLAIFGSQANAIEVAGDLIVDVDASNYEAGSDTWTNAGSYTDFAAVGNPEFIMLGDAPAIAFDGSSAFIGSDTTPDSITGFETRSIEAWVFNPSIAGEETVVSWGKRGGPDGSNMAFNYGNNGMYGAVGHWGGHDVGWVDNDFTEGAPEEFQWHHLVYTYDEEFTRVYANGELQNEEDTAFLLGELDTHADTAIAIASQWEGAASLDNVGDPALLTGPLRGTLAIGQIRIHSGVLEDNQIMANYDEEKALYEVNPERPDPFVLPPQPDPVARPLSASPKHRYSFSNPESFDAGGAELTDSIGGAHGVVVGGSDFVDPAEFTGTELLLPGGQSIDAPYGDLPNGLISGLEEVTIEGWVTIQGNQNWSRIFDFGSNSPGGDEGELEGLEDDNGGGTEGLDYIFLSAQRGGETSQRRVELRNQDGASGGGNTIDFDTSGDLDREEHFAVVYDAEYSPILDFLGRPTEEFGPGIRVYIDGELVTEASVSIELEDINDVNNWLGRSNWTNDANFQGKFDEFRIYDYVLSGDEILGSFEAGPDELVIMEGSPLDNDGDGSVGLGDLAGACDASNIDELRAELGLAVGDVDGGGVAFSDFLVLSANFGGNGGYEQGDVDCSGDIGFSDFLLISSNFGQSAAAEAASVPEPSAGLLAMCGAMLGLMFRKREGRN